MEITTSRYITLFLSSLLWFVCTLLPAKNVDVQQADHQEAFISSVSISADLFGYAYALFSDQYSSSEIGIDAGIRNIFFPTFEFGFGSSDKTDFSNGLNYRARAPYYRIGFDYNTQHKKNSTGFITVAARYGYTSFKYDIDGYTFIDPVWNTTFPLNMSDVPGSAHWFELTAGIRSILWRNIGMSWSIRYKIRLYAKDGNNSSPWYVPGMGVNRATWISGTYRVFFSIPFKNPKQHEPR